MRGLDLWSRLGNGLHGRWLRLPTIRTEPGIGDEIRATMRTYQV